MSRRAQQRMVLPQMPGSTVIARALPGDQSPATPREASSSTWQSSRGRRVVQRIGSVAATIALVLLAVGVTVLSRNDTTAHAGGVCIDTPSSNTWGPDGVRTGVDGLIDQTGPNGTFNDPLPGNYPSIEAAIADTSHTEYEKLGTSGATWSVDYGSQDDDDNACFPISKIVGNFLANSLFSISKVLSRLSISTYQWATSPGILSALNEPLDEVVHGYWNGLVKYLVGAAILLGVATVLWLAIVRRRFTLGLGGIIWMVVAVAALFMFVVKPSGIASTMDKSVSDVTNLTFANSANAMEKKDPHLAETYRMIRTQPNAGQRIASDMLWRVMVFQPWLAGQWGVTDGTPILMTTDPQQPDDTPADWYNGSRDARYQQLYAQACLLDPAVSVCDQVDSVPNAAAMEAGGRPAPGMLTPLFQVNKYSQAWYMVQNWTCQSADWCVGPAGNPDGGDDDDEREVNESNGWQYRGVWSGDKPDQRILASLTGGIAAVFLGGIIFLMAAVIITYDLMLYMLLFLAQFLLLIGIQPTWGRRITESLASQLVQNVLKRIMAGLLLSILVIIFGVLQATPLGWAAKSGLMVGVGVAVLILRKPLMDVVGVIRVGQGQTALEGVEDAAAGTVTGRSKRMGNRGGSTMRKYGKKAVGNVSPTAARRGVLGARVGTEVARERIREAAEQGSPLTPGQQRRTKLAAAFQGARAGRQAGNRFAGERDAARDVFVATGMREKSYARRGERKFAHTEQGKASRVAQNVQSAQTAESAQNDKLAGRDEAIRVAAQAKSSRFGGMAQNFDSYDESGAPVYVDRNSRLKPRGPTAGRHHIRSGDVPLRGIDKLPPAPSTPSGGEPGKSTPAPSGASRNVDKSPPTPVAAPSGASQKVEKSTPATAPSGAARKVEKSTDAAVSGSSTHQDTPVVGAGTSASRKEPVSAEVIEASTPRPPLRSTPAWSPTKQRPEGEPVRPGEPQASRPAPARAKVSAEQRARFAALRRESARASMSQDSE